MRRRRIRPPGYPIHPQMSARMQRNRHQPEKPCDHRDLARKAGISVEVASPHGATVMGGTMLQPQHVADRPSLTTSCAGKWSGRRDSNSRPPVPKTGALPDCATPRTMRPDKADSGGWKAKTARPTRPRKARRRGPDPRTGGAFPIPRRCRCAAQARH